jgi:hypothetical protein
MASAPRVPASGGIFWNSVQANFDVSHGLFSFGLPRSLLREVFAAWPDEGFHKRLLQLSLGRLLSHPWNPLPMVRV